MSLRKQVSSFVHFGIQETWKIFCKKMWADIGHTLDWSSQQCTLQQLELHHTAQEGTWDETELSCLREVIEFGKTEAIALIHCSIYLICYQI